MPYIYKETLDEGEEAMDVVERSEYDAVITERDELITQRDGAITRAETAEKGWLEAKEKYATTFLTTPSRVKEEQSAHTQKESKIMTFQELFANKGENNAL